MSHRGKVYLLGVGPGDPGLLTVRALEVMRKCTLAVYDEQVPRPILDRLPKMTERAAVTVREQADEDERLRINEYLATQARAGQRVARLFPGDPFLLGQGGEDALYFRSTGVEVEVIPGVSLALSSPTLSGIPLMQRGLFKSVFVTAGPYLGNKPITTLELPAAAHAPAGEAPPEDEPKVEEHRPGIRIRRRRKGPIPWGASAGTLEQAEAERMTGGDLAWWRAVAASADTLLLAEARSHLGVIQRGLLEGGRAAEEPVALIVGASRPGHAVHVSTIGRMARDLDIATGSTPALLVVGDVVTLRAHVGFEDLGELRNFRVALLDPVGGGAGLSEPLRQAGLAVGTFPIIRRTLAPGVVEALVDKRRTLRHLSSLVFQGPREVDAFFKALADGGLDPHTISGNCRIFLFGVGSEDALRRWGHAGTVLEGDFSPAALKRVFQERDRSEQVLLVGGRGNFQAIATWLRPRCAALEVLEVLEEHASPPDLSALKDAVLSGGLDGLLLTDAREVELLEEAWGEDDFSWMMEGLTLCAVGEGPGAALRERYIDEYLEAESLRPEDILHALHRAGTKESV